MNSNYKIQSYKIITSNEVLEYDNIVDYEIKLNEMMENDFLNINSVYETFSYFMENNDYSDFLKLSDKEITFLLETSITAMKKLNLYSINSSETQTEKEIKKVLLKRYNNELISHSFKILDKNKKNKEDINDLLKSETKQNKKHKNHNL